MMSVSNALTNLVLLSVTLLWNLKVVSAFAVGNFCPRPFQQQRTKNISALRMNADYIPAPGNRPAPQGGDMAYIKENVQQQMDTFGDIREAGGLECVNDVYVKAPQQTQFWYVGKIARCTGTVSLNAAVARQLNLIEEHSTRLRPIELGRYLGKLQVWCAPGDTEMILASNDPSVKMDRMERYVEGCENIDKREIGFNAEVVTNEGVGFFIERTDDGIVPTHLL